jgi:hypothetical protein
LLGAEQFFREVDVFGVLFLFGAGQEVEITAKVCTGIGHIVGSGYPDDFHIVGAVIDILFGIEVKKVWQGQDKDQAHEEYGTQYPVY